MSESHKGKPSSVKGYKWTKEQREKASRAQLGHEAWNKGLKCPQISVTKMGDKNPMYGKESWNKDKKMSAEHCLKLSISRGAQPFSVYKKTGEFVGRWVSQSQCSKELDILRDKISMCLSGQRKSNGGYIFKLGGHNEICF